MDPFTSVQSNVRGFSDVLGDQHKSARPVTSNENAQTYVTHQRPSTQWEGAKAFPYHISSPKPLPSSPSAIRNSGYAQMRSPSKGISHRFNSTQNQPFNRPPVQPLAQRMQASNQLGLATQGISRPYSSVPGSSFEPVMQTHPPFFPSFVEQALNGEVTSNQGRSRGDGLSDQMGDNLESLRRFTDSVVKEKNYIIDRQKVKRIQLEEQLRESEAKYRALLLTHTAATQLETDGHSANRIIPNERDFDEAAQRATLFHQTATVSKVMVEKSQTEAQLNKVVCELRDLKAVTAEDKQSLMQQVTQLQAQLTQQERQAAASTRRCDEATVELDRRKKEVKSVRRYLEDLPTAAEHTQQATRVKTLSEDLHVAQGHVKDLQASKDTLLDDLRTKSEQLADREKKVSHLQRRVGSLEKEVEIWESKEEERRTSTETDIIRLKEDAERLKDHLAKSDKICQMQTKKMAALTAKHQRTEGDLRRALDESDSMVSALREELDSKEDEINTYTLNIRQISQQKQDLMESALAARHRVEAADKVLSSPVLSLQKKLVQRVGSCIVQLEALVAVGQRWAAGGDGGEDFTALLSTKEGLLSSPATSQTEEGLAAAEGLNSNSSNVCERLQADLDKVDQLTNQMDSIRLLLLDKYAEDLAQSGSLECITQ